MLIWKGAHSQNCHTKRAGYHPEAVVLHIMDGSLIGTDSWFNDPKSHVSAHYGVGRTGEVHQYVKETDCAFHAGTVDRPEWKLIKRMGEGGRVINPNYYTIGVEHEGHGAEAWPQAMLEASLELVANIVRRWNIPADADHIIPHRDIRKSKPMCPGGGIDFAAYIGAVNRRLLTPEPPPAERSITLVLRDCELPTSARVPVPTARRCASSSLATRSLPSPSSRAKRWRATPTGSRARAMTIYGPAPRITLYLSESNGRSYIWPHRSRTSPENAIRLSA